MREIGTGRLLKRYLVTGLLVLAPISISLVLLLWLGGMVDRLLAPVTIALFGRHFIGLGLVTATLLTLSVGWLGSNIIGKQVVEVLEDLLLHVPIFSWIYRTVKQLAEAFSPAGAAAFRSVVMVEYPRTGVYQLGFATGTVTPVAGGETMTSVYIPTNHLYIGDVILVPHGKLKETSLTLQDGIQYFLSAGATAGQKAHPGDEPLGM